MRFLTRSLIALSALSTICLAQSNDLPPHSISPTPSSHLFRRGSGTLDSAAAAFESSVMSLANSASKAYRGQGVCSSNTTCGGFLHFAQICSDKGDSAAIAGCICSSKSLEIVNACTNCISNNAVKANANQFSSFCNSASSTLAILAASQTQTQSTILPSSTSSPNDQHSGAPSILLSGGKGTVLVLAIGLIGISSSLI